MAVAFQNKESAKPIKYVSELIFSVLGIQYQIFPYSQIPDALNPDLLISYGHEKPYSNAKYHIHIYESSLFGPTYLHPESMPGRPLERFDDLPIIYEGTNKVEGHVHKEETEIETDIDIIASSFFMLTRYEEVVSPVQDKFERFPATASLAYREGFLDRPIVNEYIELLWSWIDSFNLGFKRKELWGGKDFAVCLTHDVDVLRKYNWYPPLRAIASWTLKHGKPSRSLAITQDYLRAKLKRDDPHDKFDQLMELSERYGFDSSFYFMSGGETKYDNHYAIDSPYVTSLIQHIKDKGFEVGLHSSFNAYDNAPMLSKEKEKLEAVLEEPVLGVRQHYLRWRTPDSWRAREEAGFKYDTTLAFADHEGFRCGTCFPYKSFDIIKNRELNIWELPLTVMEGSLRTYQGLSPEEGFQRIKSLIDTVRKHKGVFVLLWHNSSFDDLSLPGWRGVYEEILEYLGRQNVFSDMAQGIIRWWEDWVAK